MSTQSQWWQSTGSLIVQEVEHDWTESSAMLVVASLRSKNGWITFGGSELVLADEGTVLQTIPQGLGVRIHTLAAANIIRGMTSLSEDEARTIYDDCRTYIQAHEEIVRQLNAKDPTLIAMRNLLFDCAGLKGWPLKRKAIEKTTQLAAHLKYLQQLVSEYIH